MDRLPESLRRRRSSSSDCGAAGMLTIQGFYPYRVAKFFNTAVGVATTYLSKVELTRFTFMAKAIDL